MLEEVEFRIVGTIAIVIVGINLVTAGVRFNGSDNYRNPARKPRKFLRLAGK